MSYSLKQKSTLKTAVLGSLVVGCLAMLPATVRAQQATAFLSVNNSGCAPPSGQVYATEAIGVDVNLDVLTAISTGTTTYSGGGLTGSTIQAFLNSYNSTTLAKIANKCTSTKKSWPNSTSCTFTSGSCTWTATAGTVN